MCVNFSHLAITGLENGTRTGDGMSKLGRVPTCSQVLLSSEVVIIAPVPLLGAQTFEFALYPHTHIAVINAARGSVTRIQQPGVEAQTPLCGSVTEGEGKRGGYWYQY